MPVYLLDTCAVIWIANGDPLREPAASALRESYADGGGLALSPMTAWEIAMLVAKNKIALSMGPEAWFDRVLALPGVALAALPPPVLIQSCALPGAPPADPVDRILAATARAFDHTLVTRDRHLLTYGGEGHLRVMEC
ncbi:MAG: type II toxin-antitoxin system VapC family toxin [Rhodospirillaceae bacterium]|nr:type II toxin-antitoxin system VapC family toxin [Rhodospirillaceae bacterium]